MNLELKFDRRKRNIWQRSERKCHKGPIYTASELRSLIANTYARLALQLYPPDATLISHTVCTEFVSNDSSSHPLRTEPGLMQCRWSTWSVTVQTTKLKDQKVPPSSSLKERRKRHDSLKLEREQSLLGHKSRTSRKRKK